MSTLDSSANTEPFKNPAPSLGGHAGGPAEAEDLALTENQRQILAMLEGRPAEAPPERAGPVVAGGGGFGMDIAFATVGGAAILAGATMVFFFAALGSLLLVLGAVLCAVAFEHVALRDLAAEEAELSLAPAPGAVPKNLS